MASAQVFPFPTCNVGPMHHGHIILPLGVSTVEECKTSTTQFLLSHGATFFCPHTWDIKLLASVADDAMTRPGTLCAHLTTTLWQPRRVPFTSSAPPLHREAYLLRCANITMCLCLVLAVLRACVFVCTRTHWVTGSLGTRTGTQGTFVRFYPSNSLTPPPSPYYSLQ